MSIRPGFVPLRRGLADHYRFMSDAAAKLYTWLLMKADYEGPQKGCVCTPFEEIAKALRWKFRKLEYTISKLKPKYVEVERGNQHQITRIKILRYSKSAPAMYDGSTKSAPTSAPTSAPAKFCRSTPSNLLIPEQLQPSKNLRSKEVEKEGKNPAAKPTPPADPRFRFFFSLAYESFTVKHGRKPLWQGKDRNGLKNLLKNQNAVNLPIERLQILWKNFLDSTEPFTVKQGGSLAYFCANVDKFSDGPILATPQRGARGNGKLTGTQLAIHNAKALGLYRPN